jgi:hypothetical protein
MTIAETISALLHDDGTVYTTDGGRTLDLLATANGGTVSHRESWGETLTAYTFPDGSRIIDAGAAWDTGFTAPADCFCWPKANLGFHAEDCEYFEGRIDYSKGG